MLRLYQFITSPYCAKIRKLLEYKGVPTETIELDYLERKSLVAASGQLNVPALTLESGETVVDSEKIATRIEELYPRPTIFPPGWRGVHLSLSHYFDGFVAEAIFRATMPNLIGHYRRSGAEHLAFWKLIRERKYGFGFCERMVEEHALRLERALALLVPLDETLRDRPFLTGRIGLADFALYGQLFYFAFEGEIAIPPELPNLRAFFQRVDSISAKIETATD